MNSRRPMNYPFLRRSRGTLRTFEYVYPTRRFRAGTIPSNCHQALSRGVRLRPLHFSEGPKNPLGQIPPRVYNLMRKCAGEASEARQLTDLPRPFDFGKNYFSGRYPKNQFFSEAQLAVWTGYKQTRRDSGVILCPGSDVQVETVVGRDRYVLNLPGSRQETTSGLRQKR